MTQHQGQVFKLGNLLIKWKRGDCITWSGEMFHGTCNYGHKPKTSFKYYRYCKSEPAKNLSNATT